MKRFIQIVVQIFCFSLTVSSQNIVLLKDNLVQDEITDSMNYIYSQKIIPFKDSGVVVISYADSVLKSGSQHRVVVKSFDKNLKNIWTVKLPFSTTTASISADKDDSDYVYVIYFDGSLSSTKLTKIAPNGNIVYDKVISIQISASPMIVNKVKAYLGRVLILGNVFITQKSFSPVIALFDKNGTLVKKSTLAKAVSRSYQDLYKCSILTLTNENNIVFTYQKDTNDNYGICCYDSVLTSVWSKTFNLILNSNYNLFCQDKNVVFFNKIDINNSFEILKYNSKTGEAISPMSYAINNFTDEGTNLILPTKNGNYLMFGNYSTSGGFDNYIDYFDTNMVKTSFLSNSANSKFSFGDACIVGNNIFTVSVQFVDDYCYPQVSSGYRGMLKLRKFQADFLRESLSINLLRNTKNTISIYPNPAKDKLFITINDLKKYSFIVNDLSGKHVLNGELLNSEINISSLNPGLYFITFLNSEKNIVENLKFIKD